jgi:hypothetical protein
MPRSVRSVDLRHIAAKDAATSGSLVPLPERNNRNQAVAVYL